MVALRTTTYQTELARIEALAPRSRRTSMEKRTKLGTVACADMEVHLLLYMGALSYSLCKSQGEII